MINCDIYVDMQQCNLNDSMETGCMEACLPVDKLMRIKEITTTKRKPLKRKYCLLLDYYNMPKKLLSVATSLSAECISR